jgi:hypothetical protein
MASPQKKTVCVLNFFKKGLRELRMTNKPSFIQPLPVPTPVPKTYELLRQRILDWIISSYEAESRAAASAKGSAASANDWNKYMEADAAADLAVATRDEALRNLDLIDFLMSSTTKIRFEKTREALDEAMLLAAERIRLVELWQNPSDGETPMQAVKEEIASLNLTVAYESRRIITAALEAFGEIWESKTEFVRHNRFEALGTPPLDGMDE